METQLNAPDRLPITRVMSLEATVQRISAIRHELANPGALVGSSEITGGTEAPAAGTAATNGESSFASALQQASAGYQVPAGQGSPATDAALLEDSNASAAADLGSAAGLTGYSGAAGVTSGTPGVSGAPQLSSYYQPQSLDGVAGSTSLPGLDPTAQASPGARIVAVAESQLGQTEQPPGSNESPAIATYRSATAGASSGSAVVRVLRLVGSA